MKKYVLTAGNLADMKLESFDLPAPGKGQVRVAVKAVGLNFADVFAIWGLYGATPKGPFTPGLEYSGTVEAVGEGVTHLKPGHRIMGVTRFGAYTTHLNIDAQYAIPMPHDWDYPTGAAYPVQTLTAYYGMTALGNMQRGQTVLIHSVAGGVGLQALKIARAFGCYTIGTVGNASKVDFAQTQGCDVVLVRNKDFEKNLKIALEGRELMLLMDSVGGPYLTIPFHLLAPMGRAVVFGSSRYATVGNQPNKLHMLRTWLTRPRFDPQTLPENNRGILGFNLIWLYERVELMNQLLQDVDALHLTPPHVGHILPFEKMNDAILLFQSGKTIGKVVLTT